MYKKDDGYVFVQVGKSIYSCLCLCYIKDLKKLIMLV